MHILLFNYQAFELSTLRATTAEIYAFLILRKVWKSSCSGVGTMKPNFAALWKYTLAIEYGVYIRSAVVTPVKYKCY